MTSFGHDRTRKVEEDEEDPVENMIKKTGCLEKHYTVQECMAEKQDWRQCQQEVKDFKTCMADYHKKVSLKKS